MVLLFPGLIANVLVAFEHRAHAAAHMVHGAGQVERGRRIAAFLFRNIAHGEIQAFLACRRIAAQGKATNGFPTFPGHVGGLQQIGDGIGAAVQVQRNAGFSSSAKSKSACVSRAMGWKKLSCIRLMPSSL